MRRRQVFATLACAAGTGVFGCGPKPIPDKRRELLRSWGEKFLVARYDLFIERLGDLEQASIALENTVTESRLQAAQAAWRSARRPWKETEVFKFGPVADEPLRYGAKIDFWPARPSEVDAVLSSTRDIVPDDLGAAAKGLPAVEYLLFAEEALASFQVESRRHEYLKALIEDLTVQAESLRDAWDPAHGNYLNELVHAGGTSQMYGTLSMALSEVVNRMAFTVENIRADKLGAAISPDGTPQPNKLESLFSGRSVGDIEDNLRGIETLFFGDKDQGVGDLDAYLRHRGYELSGRMRELLAESRAALELVDLPLSKAIVDEQAAVQAAIQTLGELQRLIQVDMIGALSLSVRFNDNDGD